MDYKFKIGDKVAVISIKDTIKELGTPLNTEIGDIGTILDCLEKNLKPFYRVDFQRINNYWFYLETDLIEII